jgi:6-phosphogluconate dehydrogenase
MSNANFGLIGLGTMGAALARNVNSRGYSVSTYNRSFEKTEAFLKEFGSETLSGHEKLEDFVTSLTLPRKILILVKAGPAIDAVIKQLTPLLSKGDIIIDGGNSHYKDTMRRENQSAEKGLNFFGMGISGGEEGALVGPSMMPGGSLNAYKEMEEILLASAADDGLGGKCITHMGPNGAGHFVKMVHNGIEYGIMQLTAEIYDILKNLGQLTNEELGAAFTDYNKDLNSFLLEITADIFNYPEAIIDKIKDTAKQKGTGKWTTIAALDYGVPTPTINAAVDARITSGDHDLRHRRFGAPEVLNSDVAIPEKETLKKMAASALEIASICAYSQGFELLIAASKEYDWNLNLSEIARIWRGGCIIRSNYLELFQKTYSDNQADVMATVPKLLAKLSGQAQSNWRKIIEVAVAHGIPTPTLSASLSYYDSIRRLRLPQNLTQAQRDYFGAHTYQRTDQEGTHHTEWNNPSKES